MCIRDMEYRVVKPERKTCEKSIKIKVLAPIPGINHPGSVALFQVENNFVPIAYKMFANEAGGTVRICSVFHRQGLSP